MACAKQVDIMDEPELTEPSEQTTPSERTLWHRLLGKMLELLLTPVGISVQCEVQIVSDPPRMDILLLRRDGEQWDRRQLPLLPDGIRQSKARNQLMEVKITESLNSDSLLQIQSYAYFYRLTQQLSNDDVHQVLMTARTPHSRFMDKYGYKPSEWPGVYHSDQPLLAEITLIVLNELSPTPHNAFVQCFASRRRVRELAFRQMEAIGWQQMSETLWEYVMGLRDRLTQKEGASMSIATSEGLTAEEVLKIGKRMRDALLATLTPEDRLAGLAPEDRLAGLAPEDRLAGLAPEDRLAGLAPEDRLVGLTPAELAKLMEQIERYLSQQAAVDGNP
jgi:hypothetical protein